MEETTITLNDLFSFSEAALQTELSKVVGTISMVARVAAKARHFSSESVAKDITGAIVSTFSKLDVIGLLAAAWNKEREIAKEMEKSRASGELEYIYLFERTVESTWPFVIQIEVTPLAYKIHLDLKTELTLKSGELKIENGEITDLIAGTISGKAAISVESAEIWTRECKPVELLPGRHKKELKAEAQKAAV